jgi:hypothetical protein
MPAMQKRALLAALVLSVPSIACGDSSDAPGGDTNGNDSGTGHPTTHDGSTPGDDGSTPSDDGGGGDDGSTTNPDAGSDSGPTTSAADVVQHHKNLTRDGMYIDPLMTKAAAKTLKRDTAFKGTVQGWLLAQPLYVEAGANGKATVYAATDDNIVYALDATTGAVVWQKTVAPPIQQSVLAPCGNIDTLGITGTPAIDLATRTIFVDAMTTGPKHVLSALSLDDGATRTGWPIDTTKFPVTTAGGSVTLDAKVQNQRSALTIVGGTVYVPYGGHIGDCGNYHGWVMGVPIADPAHPKSWATDSRKAGIWAAGGIASDGTSLFVSTGNGEGGGTWKGSEGLIKLGAGPTFSGAKTDYFVPSNWATLDGSDTDISGTGPIVLDLPGSTPSALLVGLGKNGVMYLEDRNNLGGIAKGNGSTGEGLASKKVANGAIINAAAAYTTANGTYVVFRGTGAGCPAGQSGELTSVKITPGSPPTMAVAWCAKQGGSGSPMVTTTDGHSEAIVWGLGAEGSNQVTGFDGDTGAVIVPGVDTGTTHHFETPMDVKGRIFVGADNEVIALTTH